jgi:hypothetical protein
MVFDAIREKQFYIYSHPNALGAVKTRGEDIVTARNPTDPFAERPQVREQIVGALRGEGPLFYALRNARITKTGVSASR